MTTNDILQDAFGRIKEEVTSAVAGLTEQQLAWRPAADANSMAWLVWHLTRVQDDHLAELIGQEQLWTKDGWQAKFGLPFAPDATGYGQSSTEVGQVKVSAELLLAYFEAVNAQTMAYLKTLKPEDYQRIVDKRWDPPVTLGVRLVSVLSDCLQHVGQAAYVRGLLPN